MLTFQANYLNSATVQRINTSGHCAKKVSFVEINPEQMSDILALHKTAIKWDKKGGSGFAYDICNSINSKIKDRFFALTTQRDEFENLDYKQILSLAQVKKESDMEEFIEYLQVNPNSIRKNKNPVFRYVGHAMLDSLKNLFRTNIELDSVKSAIKFYEENGFINIGDAGDSERRMRWECTL